MTEDQRRLWDLVIAPWIMESEEMQALEPSRKARLELCAKLVAAVLKWERKR